MIVRAAGQDDLAQILDLEAQGFAPEQRWSEQSWQSEGGDHETIIAVATFR